MPKLQNVTYQGKFHQSRGNSWVQHFQTNCSFAIFAFSVLSVWVVIFRLWKICAATKWIFIILLLHLNTVFHWLLQTRTVSWLQMRTESLACFPCKMWNSLKKCCSTEQDVLSSAFPNILILFHMLVFYFYFILQKETKWSTPQDVTGLSRLSLAYFSLPWRCLIWRSGFFIWSATSQSIPVLGSGEHLCDTTKSLTTVLAVIPGSLETSLTSLPSRFFEVFPFLPLPSLF